MTLTLRGQGRGGTCLENWRQTNCGERQSREEVELRGGESGYRSQHLFGGWWEGGSLACFACVSGNGSECMSGSSPHFRSDSSPACEPRRSASSCPVALETITLLLLLLLLLTVAVDPASGGVDSNLHLTLT